MKDNQEDRPVYSTDPPGLAWRQAQEAELALAKRRKDRVTVRIIEKRLRQADAAQSWDTKKLVQKFLEDGGVIQSLPYMGPVVEPVKVYRLREPYDYNKVRPVLLDGNPRCDTLSVKDSLEKE